MSNQYKPPSKQALIYIGICMGSAIFCIAAISSYIENGYVIIRQAEVVGFPAIMVIVALLATSLASGNLFKTTRSKELRKDENA